MQQVLIIGAGGHAQVVADILMRAREAGADITPIGYVDDNVALKGQTRLGLPILGPLSDLSHYPHDAVIIGIGDNHKRAQLYHILKRKGVSFIVARHPSAIVAPDVTIGAGSMLCAGAIVNPGSVIGANVILNTACSVDHHNQIGDHVHIAPGSHLGGEAQIGDGTLVGIGATVMPRCSVGSWSVIGAAALVHIDLPSEVVVMGVPAQVVRRINSS